MSNKAYVGSPYRRATVAVVLALAMVAAGRITYAESISQATASNAAREQALQAIPFDKLTGETQTLLDSVVSNPSIYRCLPVEQITADPDLFVFLIRQPEVIVNIWKLMGASNVTITRTGQFSVQAVDGQGTSTDVELVYGTPQLHVMYAEGTYEGPVLRRKIHGRCVLVLKSDYLPQPNGKTAIRNRLDIFVQFPNAGAALIARVLQNMVGRSADYNFAETVRFVGRLSDTAEKNGPGVERLARKLTHVQPQIRQQFVEMANVVYHRNLLRQASSRPPGTPSLQLQPASVPPQRYAVPPR